MQEFENPLAFPFNKPFSGKFGLNKDMQNFLKFDKNGLHDTLNISFYITPVNSNVSPRRDPETGEKVL